jgi:hypothetical protein
MPPSGYTVSQATHLAEFLRSCLDSLVAEAEQSGLPMIAALEKEVRDIKAALGTRSQGEYEQSVLRLTLSFYEDLASKEPRGREDALRQGHSALDLFRRAVLSIHVLN